VVLIAAAAAAAAVAARGWLVVVELRAGERVAAATVVWRPTAGLDASDPGVATDEVESVLGAAVEGTWVPVVVFDAEVTRLICDCGCSIAVTTRCVCFVAVGVVPATIAI
jgi:hypothetical protein